MKIAAQLLFALLLFARIGQAQPAGALPDSVRVALRVGSDNQELNQLLAHVLHIEKLHFDLQDLRLAGKRFHLTYQEYRNGVPGAEKELADDPTRLTSFDPQGRFNFDVFARQATETTVRNQFIFAAGSTEESFTVLPGKGDLYSLRFDIWTYHQRPSALASANPPLTTERNFPVGKKVPFLVYTLPYEKDGWLLWCSLAQSKIPVAKWYEKFKISHFVVYNLIIDLARRLPATPAPGSGTAEIPGVHTLRTAPPRRHKSGRAGPAGPPASAQ